VPLDAARDRDPGEPHAVTVADLTFGELREALTKTSGEAEARTSLTKPNIPGNALRMMPSFG